MHQLFPLVYEELRRLAHWQVQGKPADHILANTGLVTLARNGELHVNKWSGKVTTVLGSDQPVTPFEGCLAR
jgi:hypothetical protein